MNAEVLETLTDALKLIRNPRAWTQKAAARDSNGYAVPSISPQAVCWCAMGALSKASMPFDIDAFSSAILLLEEIAEKNLGAFNDKSSHEDVVALFKKEITDAAP